MVSPRRFDRLRVALVCAAIVLLAVPANGAVRSVWILHTTDFHGAVLGGAKDRESGRPIGTSAAVAAYIDRVRKEHPGDVLLLDGGDAMQGTAISNLVAGRCVIDIMNAMHYDAMAIGNHEFDWGLDTLKARMHQATFPFLSANIFEKATGRRPEWAKPDTIFERGGLRIGVIGITTTSTPYTTLPQNVADFEFRDPVPVVEALVPSLKAAGAQAIVVLAHEGGQQRRNGEIVGPIADLARGAAGVDAVFGGHTHTWVSGRVGNVPVVVSSSSGRAYGEIRLDWDDAAGKIVDAEPSLMTVFADSIAPDPDIAAVASKYEAAIGPAMSRVVATAAVDLGRDTPQQQLGVMIADIIRRAAHTDLAMENPGGVRAEIPAGPITVAKVYELMPFDNVIVVYTLTGAQVRRVLEDGLAYGRPMQTSGLGYAFDLSRPKGHRLTSVDLDSGAPLDTSATYTFATNDFLAGGGDGMDTLKGIDHVTNTNILVRDEIVAWFEAETAAGRQISPPETGRIRQEGSR